MKHYTSILILLSGAFSKLCLAETATSNTVANLEWFAQYSAAAYCSDNYLVPYNGSSVCPQTICPLLPSAPDLQLVDSFIKVSYYQTTGLIFADHTNELIVISFRGTHSSQDWLTDLDFLLRDASDICHNCQAHSGFLGSWRGVRDIVLQQNWNVLREKYPTYSTVVTGHSLGGALANLCAAQMKKAVPSATVYLFTYGSPRVGDDEFAKYIEKQFGWRNYRVTHLNDPVPRLPPQWPGFKHPKPEYSITSPDFSGVLSANASTLMLPANLIVDPTDVLVIDKAESNLGSDGYDCLNPSMHFGYLGPISGCGSNGNYSQYDNWQNLCGDLFACCNGITDG